MHRLAVIAAACAGLAVLCMGIFQSSDVASCNSPFGPGEPDGGLQLQGRPEATMPQTFVHGGAIAQSADFAAWHRVDSRYLAELAPRVIALDGRAIRETEAEVSFIQQRIALLEANPSYRDPDLGFSVYDTWETGWLHVLDVAARARETLLETGSIGAVRAVDEFYRLAGGTPLCEADPARMPEVEDVAATLRAIDLPREAFVGYRVYLLPLSMGDTGGLGASGYALVGAPPRGRQVIANQTEVTVAHEFGHHVQLMSMGSSYWDNPMAWRDYMAVRGIRGWSADGEATSPAWAESPEETFAEDVRVLFGPDCAADDPHATAYGDPRTDPALAARIREVIRDRAASMRQGREREWRE